MFQQRLPLPPRAEGGFGSVHKRRYAEQQIYLSGAAENCDQTKQSARAHKRIVSAIQRWTQRSSKESVRTTRQKRHPECKARDSTAPKRTNILQGIPLPRRTSHWKEQIIRQKWPEEDYSANSSPVDTWEQTASQAEGGPGTPNVQQPKGCVNEGDEAEIGLHFSATTI